MNDLKIIIRRKMLEKSGSISKFCRDFDLDRFKTEQMISNKKDIRLSNLCMLAEKVNLKIVLIEK
jgi:hypothetical protein